MLLFGAERISISAIGISRIWQVQQAKMKEN